MARIRDRGGARCPAVHRHLPLHTTSLLPACSYLSDTGVQGGIPAQWCSAAFAQSIRIM